MGEVFNADRIILRDGVPEYFCHGVRLIERMPADMVRITLCRDQGVDIDGIPPLSLPVVVINVPLACMIWNMSATAQWAIERRLLHVKPVGPAALPSPYSPFLM